jgi:hypothetical protein
LSFRIAQDPVVVNVVHRLLDVRVPLCTMDFAIVATQLVGLTDGESAHIAGPDIILPRSI